MGLTIGEVKPTRTRRQGVRRLRRRLDKAGLLARAAAILAVAQGPEFQARLNVEVAGAGGDWVRDNHDARKVVIRILNAMGVDHRDIALTFTWEPGKRKLGMWARPAPAVVQKLAQKAKLRAVGPTEPPPKGLPSKDLSTRR